VDPGKKNSIFPRKFPENFDFFSGNFKQMSIFTGKFSKNFDFFRHFHKSVFRFSRQKLVI